MSEPIVAGQGNRLVYPAELRDGTGAVTTGTAVKLEVYNHTDDKWWDGAAWTTGEVALTATTFTLGLWLYDWTPSVADAGDKLVVAWFDEADGCVAQIDTDLIRSASDLMLADLTDIEHQTWDALATAHTDAGSFGQMVALLPTGAEIANAVWDEEINTSHQGAYVAGRALRQAAQVLGGRAVANETANTIDVYDMAGSGIILTLTFAEAAPTITRTPS